MEDTLCVVAGCVATSTDGVPLCAVHRAITRRDACSVPIHCYACGGLIRKTSLWFVRAEGAFHNRRTCLVSPPQDYKIPLSIAEGTNA